MNFDNINNRTPSRLKIGKFESKKNRLKRNSQLLVGSPTLLDNSLDSTIELNKRIKIELENNKNEYEFSLNLYAIPPFGPISLKDAQRAVEERLKVLNVFEDMSKDPKAPTTKDRVRYFEELNARFKSLGDVFINEVHGGKDNFKVQAARRRDHISHFLLRLLCCQNDALKRFFIQREVDLLKYRLENEKNYLDLVKFLTYNNLNFEEPNSKEKQILIKQNKINFNNSKALSTNVFYKIRFEEALELVRTRRVYLQDGYCYCSSIEMVTIISSKFKLELSRSLASLYNSLPFIDENKRLLPIFETIYNNLITARKSFNQMAEGNKERITPDMIDELAVTSFPPCMRNVHELLRLNHHLKHYGRLHYGLFLKGIGLNLDDALSFFREEFIKNITPEKFQKEYSYGILYNYGKVGKKTNFSPFSCSKIQSENPGAGDSHGCPFKHYDKSNLIKMLKRHNIDETNIQAIVSLSQQHEYNSACSNYFSCKNKNVRVEIKHPNQYYRESRKVAQNIYLTNENDKNENKVNEDNLDFTNLDLEEDIEMEFEKELEKNSQEDKSTKNTEEKNLKNHENNLDQDMDTNNAKNLNEDDNSIGERNNAAGKNLEDNNLEDKSLKDNNLGDNK